MPQPVYVTNLSEITRLEGLYIRKRTPPATVQGVGLSDVVVVGECVRGPVDRMVEIGSEARFVEVFGGRDYVGGGIGTLKGKVWQALVNKAFGAVQVVRAAAAGAVTASKAVKEGTAAWTRDVTCDTKANHGAADIITLDDGDNPAITFELDKAGDGVVGGRVQVDISGAVTAQDVAVLLVAAINTKIGLGLLNLATVAAPVAGVITLVASVLGSAGDVDVTETGALTLGAATGGVDTTRMTITASSVGEWGNGVEFTVEDATDGDADHFNLRLTYRGDEVVLEDLDISGTSDNLAVKLGDDDATWVTLDKSTAGRPDNQGPTALASGADGAIADSDFTAAGRALEVAFARERGVAAYFVAGRSNAAIKAALKVKAAALVTGKVLVCADSSATSKTTANAEAVALGSEGIVYCFNHVTTLDPDTGLFVEVEPTAWLASVLSQIDPEINPGDESTKAMLAGINRLHFGMTRADLIAAKAAGVCALTFDDGAVFYSGITTGKTEIADDRSVQFLNESIGQAWKHQVKKPNTKTRRRAMVAAAVEFLDDLKRAERIVEDFEVDGEILNSPATRGLNQERILLRGRLIPHLNFVLVESEIGTTVRIAR